MNFEQLEAQLKQSIDEVLRDFPDAKNFLLAYCEYTHSIDDIIDDKITSSDVILKTFNQSANIFNCNFWRQNASQLFLIEKLINLDYGLSVKWEKSDEAWKRNQADVLRNAGNMMTFAVILLIAGYDKAKELIPLIREHSYYRHHDEEGKPV